MEKPVQIPAWSRVGTWNQILHILKNWPNQIAAYSWACFSVSYLHFIHEIERVFYAEAENKKQDILYKIILFSS